MKKLFAANTGPPVSDPDLFFKKLFLNSGAMDKLAPDGNNLVRVDLYG